MFWYAWILTPPAMYIKPVSASSQFGSDTMTVVQQVEGSGAGDGIIILRPIIAQAVGVISPMDSRIAMLPGALATTSSLGGAAGNACSLI